MTFEKAAIEAAEARIGATHAAVFADGAKIGRAPQALDGESFASTWGVAGRQRSGSATRA
jgi:hypothetical protein